MTKLEKLINLQKPKKTARRKISVPTDHMAQEKGRQQRDLSRKPTENYDSPLAQHLNDECLGEYVSNIQTIVH